MFLVPELFGDVCVVQPEKSLQEFYGHPTRLVRIAPKYNREMRNESRPLVLKLDVSQYQPEEITIKLEENNLVIMAKHEEQRGDFDSCVNYMTRKTRIPEDADLDGIISKFSKDGILTVTVPKKVVKIEGDRIIPIIRTDEVLRPDKKEKTAEVDKQEVNQGVVENREDQPEDAST